MEIHTSTWQHKSLLSVTVAQKLHLNYYTCLFFSEVAKLIYAWRRYQYQPIRATNDIYSQFPFECQTQPCLPAFSSSCQEPEAPNTCPLWCWCRNLTPIVRQTTFVPSMLRVAGRGTRGSPRDALGSRPHTAALLYMAAAAPQLEFQLSRPIIWVSLNPSDCEKKPNFGTILS